ncbi:MAG: hypothetical protein PF572_06315 [Patescibacteria group bacterium]|jgi:hypothetical protein|nr:hypothetical protein [Patescibacteria group bacterium]
MNIEGNNALEQFDTQEIFKKELKDFLLNNNYIFNNKSSLEAILEETEDDLEKIYMEVPETANDGETISEGNVGWETTTRIRSYLNKSGYGQYLKPEKEILHILVQEIFDDNKDFFRDINIQQVEMLSKNIPINDNFDNFRETIFMKLVEQKEKQEGIKTVENSNLIAIRDSVEFKNKLAKNIHTIKTSNNDILKQKTKGEAREIIDSISNIKGSAIKRTINKIQSQIDYLEN